MAITIKITPGSTMGIAIVRVQTCLDGHICECLIAIIVPELRNRISNTLNMP